MVTGLQWQVTRAVRAGVKLDEIEARLIDPARVDEDEKAALWLYAETLVDRREEAIPIKEEAAPIGR